MLTTTQSGARFWLPATWLLVLGAACSARDLSYLQLGNSGSVSGGSGATGGTSAEGGKQDSAGANSQPGGISSSAGEAGSPNAGAADGGESPSNPGQGGNAAGAGGVPPLPEAGAAGEGPLITPDPELPVLSCGGTVCSSALMIADMEKNDGTACATDGRSGYGLIIGDGTGTQWPENDGSPLTKFSPLDKCRGKSAVAFHTKGVGFTSWGAGMAMHFSSAGFDACAYGGITFWAMSPTRTKLKIGVVSAETQDVTYGGTCEPSDGKACADHFGSARTLTPTWVSYTVSFAELKQGGWGVPAPTSTIDCAKLMELNITFEPKSEHYDVWLDDVSFYQ